MRTEFVTTTKVFDLFWPEIETLPNMHNVLLFGATLLLNGCLDVIAIARIEEMFWRFGGNVP